MNTIKSYTGRGEVEILTHITANGALNGEMIRWNGDHVADVCFDIVDNNLVFTVNNQSFRSVNEALVTLEPVLGTRDTAGSGDNGNAANNIIGRYNAFRHIVFGNITLADIVYGGDCDPNFVTRTRSVKSKPVKSIIISVDPLDRPISEFNLEELYGKGTIAHLRAKYPETALNEYRILTRREYEARYALTIKETI